jgi:hypothetical protein
MRSACIKIRPADGRALGVALIVLRLLADLATLCGEPHGRRAVGFEADVEGRPVST